MIPRRPGARMKALLLVVGGVAGVVLGIAEAVALRSGESILWSISKVVWQASAANPIFIALPCLLLGMLLGHFYFPKGKCVFCGSRPWAWTREGFEQFKGQLLRFANLRVAERRPGNDPDTVELMRRAGFPVEG